jgi:FAD-linked sulfhydryl oxidase
MAAYFPPEASDNQQNEMKTFLSSFSKFYPCHYCADHLQEYISEHPPVVRNNQELSQWMCEMHNDVNERLGAIRTS